MVDPTYPTKKNNPPPILEGGHDDLIGEPFKFVSEMLEDVQALSQPANPATVGTLTEIKLEQDSAPYTSLAGIVLASCRVQTGVSLINQIEFVGESATGATVADNGVFTQFCHFQEGKFSQPPFVFVQPFEDYDSTAAGALQTYHQPVQVDRVTTAGFRTSYCGGDAQDTFRFFWIAIQPPFPWRTDFRFNFVQNFDSNVEDDPSTPAWEDL